MVSQPKVLAIGAAVVALAAAGASFAAVKLAAADSPGSATVPRAGGIGFEGRLGGRGFGGGVSGVLISPPRHRLGGSVMRAELAAGATLLGLDAATLHNQLDQGTTLAAIAGARGTSTKALEATLVAAGTTALTSAVKAEHLTAAQEAAMRGRLRGQVEAFVRGAHRPGWWSSNEL